MDASLQKAEQIALSYAAHCSDIGILARAFIHLLKHFKVEDLIPEEVDRKEGYDH